LESAWLEAIPAAAAAAGVVKLKEEG